MLILLLLSVSVTDADFILPIIQGILIDMLNQIITELLANLMVVKININIKLTVPRLHLLDSLHRIAHELYGKCAVYDIHGALDTN